MDERNALLCYCRPCFNYFSLTKCDRVRVFCCERFLVPLSVSCVLMTVEFKLFFSVLSVNIALLFKGVASIVSGIIVTLSLCTEIVLIAALDRSVVILRNEE